MYLTVSAGRVGRKGRGAALVKIYGLGVGGVALVLARSEEVRRPDLFEIMAWMWLELVLIALSS